MLRADDQESFEQLWELAAYDSPSIKAAGLTDIDWDIPFAICRVQQQEIEVIREEVTGEDCTTDSHGIHRE